MKTFERYFLEEETTWKENKNPFYTFSKDEEYCVKILKEFGLDEDKGHIICGHIPVKFKAGESPIRANGKMLIIDGGLSKSYQKTTGIAGYTLIYNSYGLILAAHETFTSTEDAIKDELDLHSTKQIVEKVERKKIIDTDKGNDLVEQIEDLNKLLDAYKNGIIKEKIGKYSLFFYADKLIQVLKTFLNIVNIFNLSISELETIFALPITSSLREYVIVPII